MLVRFTIISFLISLILCFCIVALFISNEKLRKLTADSNKGKQKFHQKLTPRIGGLGVFSATTLSFLLLFIIKGDMYILYFILATLPAFFSGFIEDITKRITPGLRLISTVFAALLGVYLLNGVLHRIDIAIFDRVLNYRFAAILFTLLAVSGVSNSINIIDGYNGLASAVSVLILLGLAYISHKVHDDNLVFICFITIGAIAGFFIWNYPFGRIFLGDGGAYFVGFIIAEVSILLVNNHKEVSAWFPMLLVVYPVFETVFSIYRRRFLKRVRVDGADALHLHQLMYSRVVPKIYNINRKETLIRNSATSPLLWFVCSMSVLPAIIFWRHTHILQLFVLIFCIIYILLYFSIVRFKIDRILRIN